jgi:hypothetical protein
MPRTCFVIMPFSDSLSCAESEWTLLFESLFKPAIESAGLDYECRRSVATRGNIVATILQELKENYVVLADLTDQKANVFYELGVRHTLKNRTILIAQKAEDIPFDLRAYAYHIYDWQTEEGKEAFTNRITELLAEIDSRPDRPDNPVSDFLGTNTVQDVVSVPVSVSPREISYAQSLTGITSEGLDSNEFARRLARSGTPQSANTILRITRNELIPLVKEKMAEQNQKEVPSQITNEQVISVAQEFIQTITPLVRKIEEFVLTSVEEKWEPGLKMGLRLCGDLISLSERTSSGRINRFSQGTPQLLAWRLLIFCGSIALSEEYFDLLSTIMNEPIEVEDNNSRFSHLPLIKRRDLFWPDAMLGNALDGAMYIVGVWDQIPHLQHFFQNIDDYHFKVSKFLMVCSLVILPDGLGHPLYPGFRLFPQARRSMSALCSKMANSEPYLQGIAGLVGESAAAFREKWAERARATNNIQLGSRHPWITGLQFPLLLNAEPTQE